MTDATSMHHDGDADGARLLQLMAASLGKPVEQLAPERRLVEDLNLDSVDRLSLLMVLEREYDAEIPDEVLPTFVTIADIVAYVRTNVIHRARQSHG